jgi:hypothetical protein
MKRTFRAAPLAAVAAILLMGANYLPAQTNGNQDANRGRGGRDPAQFMERRMERYREQLEIQSDDEWKAVQPLLEKVVQAQREVRIGGFGGFGGGGRGGPPGGPQNDPAGGANGRGNRGNRGIPDANSNPEAAALRQAVDAKAPTAEIKARLARLREALKQKEADLTKAQEALRQVLTTRQEAVAVLNGLLR